MGHEAMDELEKRAREDLSDLASYLHEAVALAYELVSVAKLQDDEHLIFAILIFLSKLQEQAGSVELLVSQGHGRDAELVARSMLESLAILLWMARDPAVRPLQWRSFAAVHDWRLLRKSQSEGTTVDLDKKREVEDGINRYGSLHENPKCRGKADPYYKNWRGKLTVKEIFEEVSGDTLYVEIYGPLSDWIHSGVQTIGSALLRTETEISWNPPPPTTDASAYEAAFQSLGQGLLLGAKHFDSELLRKAEDLIDRYKARFSR